MVSVVMVGWDVGGGVTGYGERALTKPTDDIICQSIPLCRQWRR